MERFLWICFAGALGTGVRYLVGQWVGDRLGAGFPIATLAVNLVGCFAMAFAMHMSLALTTVTPTMRMALTTGFLGGLTTYSSFNHETTALLGEGARTIALLNVAATVIGSLIAGVLGLWCARRVFGG